MKFSHLSFAVAAAVLCVGCVEKSDESAPLRVLSLGEPVTTNPLGLDHCKPAESADVLASLRRIDDKFYYMDYTIDLQLDSLIDKDLRSVEDFNLALHSILFNEPEKEDFGDINALSCSGFACKNPAGQTLFGRNFDGGAGPLLLTFNTANWQQQMTNKLRVEHMMNFYHPVMTEMEALECLQEGHYGIEEYGGVTDWSMVFNPAERTILFNMRNDMSKIYTLDLKKDLGW